MAAMTSTSVIPRSSRVRVRSGIVGALVLAGVAAEQRVAALHRHELAGKA